jgi:hypothetical protein
MEQIDDGEGNKMTSCRRSKRAAEREAVLESLRTAFTVTTTAPTGVTPDPDIRDLLDFCRQIRSAAEAKHERKPVLMMHPKTRDELMKLLAPSDQALDRLKVYGMNVIPSPDIAPGTVINAVPVDHRKKFVCPPLHFNCRNNVPILYHKSP